MEGEQARVGFWFPYILRGAVRATILKRVNVEAAFVYEGWSMHDTVSIQPLDDPGIWVRNVPTIGDYKIRTMTIPRAFHDAFSIRLGGDVLIVPGWLRLRLGYTYESTAIPAKTTTVFIIDADKHMIGLGLSLLLGKKMALDLSFAHFIMTTRNITNSEYPQVNPINPEGAIFVGNGRYESSYNIVGLAWRGSF
jgi:long-chain fatty acid transport protein